MARVARGRRYSAMGHRLYRIRICLFFIVTIWKWRQWIPGILPIKLTEHNLNRTIFKETGLSILQIKFSWNFLNYGPNYIIFGANWIDWLHFRKDLIRNADLQIRHCLMRNHWAIRIPGEGTAMGRSRGDSGLREIDDGWTYSSSSYYPSHSVLSCSKL